MPQTTSNFSVHYPVEVKGYLGNGQDRTDIPALKAVRKRRVAFFFATTIQLITVPKFITSRVISMTDTAAVQPRIVPGAPPPVALSKSQKKKRRAKGVGGKSEHDQEDVSSPTTGHASGTPVPDATLAPEASDTQEGALAPEPVSRSGSQAPLLPEEDVLLKHSPIVDLVNKRLKATGKKIVSTSLNLLDLINYNSRILQARISSYASTDIEKLNDDQKRSIKNLQTLDAIVKELGEVKKAIEVRLVFE